MFKMILSSIAFCICCFSISSAIGQKDKDDEKVTVSIYLNKEIGPMYPVWAWFGYDEPNYTYMKDGKKLLSEIAEKSTYKIHESVSISFEDSKQYKIIQFADLVAGFIMRSWNDFFYGNFKSLNRYVSIWQHFILEDAEGDEQHPSVGANMVIPEFHYGLLIHHLRKF